MKRIGYVVFISSIFFLVGCGNTLSCALSGDNVSGRFTFVDQSAILDNVDMRAEWSNDSFQTIGGGNSTYNLHGLSTFRYSMCVNDGTFQVRLFQDANRNGVLDTGEKMGRYDGTADGDAAYLSKTLSSTSTVKTLEGIDVTIDKTF